EPPVARVAPCAADSVLFSEIKTAARRSSIARFMAAGVAGSARQFAVPKIQTQPPVAASTPAADPADPCRAQTVLARRSGKTTPSARAPGLLREHGRAGQAGRRQPARGSQAARARNDRWSRRRPGIVPRLFR